MRKQQSRFARGGKGERSTQGGKKIYKKGRGEAFRGENAGDFRGFNRNEINSKGLKEGQACGGRRGRDGVTKEKGGKKTFPTGKKKVSLPA